MSGTSRPSSRQTRQELLERIAFLEKELELRNAVIDGLADQEEEYIDQFNELSDVIAEHQQVTAMFLTSHSRESMDELLYELSHRHHSLQATTLNCIARNCQLRLKLVEILDRLGKGEKQC